jgi:hypothetical protein
VSVLITVTPLVEQNQKTLGELQELSANLQEKGIRSALRVAAKPLQAAMQAAAPDDSRTPGSRLARSINITQAKTGATVRTGAGDRAVVVGDGEVGVIVGPNKKVGGTGVGYIGWMLESGTKAHKIKSKRKFLKIGGRFAGRSVMHPGVKAMAWMSRSFDSASSLVEEGFYTGLEKWMDKNGR